MTFTTFKIIKHMMIFENTQKSSLSQLQIKSPKCLQFAQFIWMWCYLHNWVNNSSGIRFQAHSGLPEELLLSFGQSLLCPPWLQSKKNCSQNREEGEIWNLQNELHLQNSLQANFFFPILSHHHLPTGSHLHGSHLFT